MASDSNRSSVHRWVFWPAASVAIVFSTFAIVAPQAAEVLFSTIQTTIVNSFNWYYVLIASFFVVFCLWVGFSRFGDIKLGKDDDKPEFSLMAWFSLLFAAGMGIGLVFYGVSEPLSHYVSPPPGVTGTPAQLAQLALSQTYLHWGIHAWSIYVVVGLALSYAIHRRGRPISIRWTLEPLLGKRVRGGWGNAIDVIALVGTLFGVATSLGLGVLQISSGLSSAGIAQPNVTTQIIIIVVITILVLFSVLSGVTRAMKWLSSINLIMAGLFVLYLLAAGPTTFLLREFVQTFGAYIQNFVGLSFNVNAFTGSAGEAWQATWTSFYWGWWIAWAPFVGIFIARISRGRTVRQFVVGVILVPTIMGVLWFSVLGGSALALELGGTSLVKADGTVDLEGSLFSLLNHLPGTAFLTVGVILIITIFFVTSADSGALVMGMIATGGNPEPRRWARIFFTLITAALAIALLLSGGLKALQTAAIIIALPFSVVMLLMCWSTIIAFMRERQALEKAQRDHFIDRIGEHYGLEVEGPIEQGITIRTPRWLRRFVPGPRASPKDEAARAPTIVDDGFEGEPPSSVDQIETDATGPPDDRSGVDHPGVDHSGVDESGAHGTDSDHRDPD